MAYTFLVAITREALFDTFSTSGHQLWLVGGALRDRLLGRECHDYDYATDANPDEIEAMLASRGATITTVGKRWGTIGVLVTDGDSQDWSEITTFRGDSYSDGKRWPEVTFGSGIEEDLERRDFSINAMAENVFNGGLLDRFGGRADTDARVIRAVGEPVRRFEEDPLRILRGIRFSSQLGFTIEARTFAGMKETASLLATLSQERVTSELDKLLCGEDPRRGLESLRECGALEVVLPELDSMAGCEQNRFHHFDVWGHTVATVEAVSVVDGRRRLRRWAALVHDMGKPAVRHVKANGEWGFYRHETVGAELAAQMLERLKLGRAESHEVVLLVRRHMDRPDPADSRSVRRFMAKASGYWRDLVALKRADNASHTYEDSAYHDALQEACERAEREDSERLKAESPLSGDDLVRLFDREPGPWIRTIKDRLSAMVLDGELEPGDRVTAERVVQQMVTGSGGGRSGAAGA